METILDQFESEKLPKPIEEKPVKIKKEKNNKDVEEKREQLSILAVLGNIESYTGSKMSLGDVKKLKNSDVEKNYHLYQTVIANQMTGSLIDSGLGAAVKLVSYVLPIDDEVELCKDLRNNELVKQELNNTIGFTLLKGGRYVALASGLLQVVKHIQFFTTANVVQNAEISSANVEQIAEVTEQSLNTL